MSPGGGIGDRRFAGVGMQEGRVIQPEVLGRQLGDTAPVIEVELGRQVGEAIGVERHLTGHRHQRGEPGQLGGLDQGGGPRKQLAQPKLSPLRIQR